MKVRRPGVASVRFSPLFAYSNSVAIMPPPPIANPLVWRLDGVWFEPMMNVRSAEAGAAMASSRAAKTRDLKRGMSNSTIVKASGPRIEGESLSLFGSRAAAQ